jgi:uncharacterized protein
VDGFAKLGRSTVYMEGILIDMPMVIEIIEERSKLQPLLPQIKSMIGENGLVTLHEVEAF